MNNNNNVDAKGWDYEHKLAYQYEREIKDCYERALDALREARDHFASAKVLGVRPDCGFEDGECIDNLQRCIEYGRTMTWRSRSSTNAKSSPLR
ncbi:uncharacterized protein ACA1_079250 [Acanthamoeba castellanii str. Neff]|uniref:Uncharacterized protein n=1 Tax=Acanthamoeba castellanii (strain ATCC 30010 / Neff) TaxID=1257118 RepID=L8GSB3_ACACF|nr:uncharacterized protein ACA1_079250 [Acanthamoeba castellanii str. Neff]ELR15827.1 hypothetical protein ACA1_079250 [Acanthamoeba castellanii str. Neff]